MTFLLGTCYISKTCDIWIHSTCCRTNVNHATKQPKKGEATEEESKH